MSTTSINPDLGTTTTLGPQAKEEKKAAGTEYIVLELMQASSLGDNPRGQQWEVVGRTKATSSQDAIRKSPAREESEVISVAVPVRSWQPVKVKVETTTRLTLEEA